MNPRTRNILIGSLVAFVLLCCGVPVTMWQIAGMQPSTTQDCADERELFIESQFMRVIIKIDRATNTWTMDGIPSKFPHTADEVVPTQLQALRIYESYGLYEVEGIEETLGRIEYFIGKRINSQLTQEAWHNEGDITPDMSSARCFN
ncbi:MAG: hypothetical protein M3P98_04510 [bacterium]|nr:hypothetical protein [bacterium]